MTRDEFDIYCQSLPATTHVIQWGNASVWKVGGKIFALCGKWGDGDDNKVSFKCSDMSYEILCEQDGVNPAPYLARAKWVQVIDDRTLNDDDIRAYVSEAHQIISAKLTKAMRAELGLT